MRIERQKQTNAMVIYKDDATILISYSTPVAALIFGRGYVRTNKFWSVTTSRHINAWLDDRKAELVDQSVLNELVK